MEITFENRFYRLLASVIRRLGRVCETQHRCLNLGLDGFHELRRLKNTPLSAPNFLMQDRHSLCIIILNIYQTPH